MPPIPFLWHLLGFKYHNHNPVLDLQEELSVIRPLKILSLIAFLFFLGSCASYFVRKECEKTNWFEFGRSVALKGERLSGNDHIVRCEQVEAQIDHAALDLGFKAGMERYCQPDMVFAIGRRGEFFNLNLCDGDKPRLLQAKHADGVALYCQKGNGFAAGALGTPYNNICPKNLEPAFLVEFNRGRKNYLQTVISVTESEIDDLRDDIDRLEKQRTSIAFQMNALGKTKTIKKAVVYDPVSRTHKEEISIGEDESTRRRKDSLQWDLDRVTREIESKLQKQTELRKKIREIKTELVAL